MNGESPESRRKAGPDFLGRLDLALRHFRLTEAIVEGWVETFRVTHDPDPNSTGRVVRLHASPAPPELGLEIGECLHNARAFLDNLVFHLASVYSGSAFTPKMQATSEFPIFSDRAPTNAELDRRVGGIDPAARSVIDRLQPHHRPDWTEHPLYRLHELDRINKHRYVLPAAGGHLGTGVGLPTFMDRSYIESLTIGEDPIVGPNGSAVLGRYVGWHEIAGQRFTTMPLAIEKGAVFTTPPFRGALVTTTLKSILDHVRDRVVPELQPFF